MPTAQQDDKSTAHEAHMLLLLLLGIDNGGVACSLGCRALRGSRPVEGAQAQRRVAGALAGAAPARPGPAGPRVPMPAGSSARRASAAPAAG